MRQIQISNSITVRDAASLERYFKEISKVKLLTHQEETMLAQQIKKGDLEALEKLCLANLRFVVSVAKHYLHQGLAFADLINEGNLGLLKACERFDETRGFKFISYAVWWVRQSILLAIAEHSRIVRLPQGKMVELSGINKTLTELHHKFEREPTCDEIAEIMGTNEGEVRVTLSLAGKHVSLDAPVNQEREDSLLDVTENSNSEQADRVVMYHESLRCELNRSLSMLTKKQRDIVQMYFGIDRSPALSLNDIGAHYNLTRERVRQIKDIALETLKTKHCNAQLREYLG